MSDQDTDTLQLPTAGASTPNAAFKVANVPKISYQDPASIQTNYAWGTPVDFVLSRNIGKVLDMVLQIDIVNTGTGAEAGSYLPPTPFWFERCETSLGGSAPIETVNKDECFTETLMFLPLSDFQTIAPQVNINSDGSFVKTSSLANKGIPSGRYFLPLWSNCANTAQLYLKGFSSDWKLRFFLSTAQPDIANAGAASTVSITGLRILITEAQLAPNVEARLAYKHSKGVVYETINRIRHVDTNMPTSTSSIKEYQLTTFSNESSGVLTYFRDGDNRYPNLGKRLKLTTLNFRDAQGNPYYATDIDGNYNLFFMSPYAVNKVPLNANMLSVYNYLIPFSSHVGAVLETGKDLGAYQLSGREKLTLQPAVLPTAAVADGGFKLSTDGEGFVPPSVFVAVSYDYMRFKVKNGNCRVYYNRA
jgi:hypothetical protein